MRIKITDTWKTRVDVSLPGDGVDEFVDGHFVAEFKELSLSQMKATEKERRSKVSELAELREAFNRERADEERRGVNLERERIRSSDRAEIERLEDELANADRALLDRVLVAVHGLELEKADGSVMTQSELMDYVKDHTDFMVPIVQAFAGRIQRIAEKNSKRPGKN